MSTLNSQSIYPRSIPLFGDHKNLLDDVDANHINRLQREITAGLSVLGINPQIYNDVTSPVITTAAFSEADSGGIVSGSSTSQYTTTPRSYNPLVASRDYETVAARLDALEKGTGKHCFKLIASNIDMAQKANIPISTPATLLRFPTPSPSSDPYNLFDGMGVTLRKSGFYVIHGEVLWRTFRHVGTLNDGEYLATIDHSGHWLEGLDLANVPTQRTAVTLHPTIMGFFNRGTTFALRTDQSSDTTQHIQLASLAGYLVRESDEG